MYSLQEFIIAGTFFINDILIPFLFTLALLFFVYNAFRFFIAGANDTDAKEKSRRLAFYGIAAFVLLVSIWGIVNMLIRGLGWGSTNYLEPDYIYSDWYNAGSQTEYCRLNPTSIDCR